MTTSSPRLLIAEDDYAIATNLHTWFERKGFEVESVYSGTTALHRCSTERFDVIVLDVGLPGMCGLDFLRRLRGEQRLTTPVLVVSARSDVSDRLAGFAHGADDYVVKPFAFAELEARVRALLHRSRTIGRPGQPLRLGRLELDAAEMRARVGEQPVRLTPKTAQLLELLMRRPGELVRRREVEQALWEGVGPNAEALRAQVHGLRKSLADVGFDGIETVHGVGWRIVGRGAAP